jgi:pyruvate/2-oxoglutarate/acetoin dehydrogenase E1 component
MRQQVHVSFILLQSQFVSFSNFVVVFGEDVAFGGVFRCTLGLAEMFGML